jgi:hypothetical protein
MKMSIPTMGPNTDFKQWKRNFLTFLSLEAASLIPQLAIGNNVSRWTRQRKTMYTLCYCTLRVKTSPHTKQSSAFLMLAHTAE